MADANNNPLLNPPELPHDAPALDQVRTEHFLPALEATIALARKNVEKIRDDRAEPTFENTIAALAFADHRLRRVCAVFNCISGANGNDEIRAMETKFNVERVKYSDDIMMDAKLFARVKSVYDKRDSLKLSGEQKQLLEKTYRGFVRSGALLGADDQKELRKVNERLSELGTKYKNNSVKATAAYKKVISDEKDLAGLPERVKNTYRENARKAGLKDKWVILLSPPPLDLLEYSENRALREEITRARTLVGCAGEFDNREIVLETVRLRQRLAKLLGYTSYAAFVLDDRMAGTPEKVMDFLTDNKDTYKPAAKEFLQQVKDFALKTDGLKDFKPWDFFYYRQRLQKETFDFDQEELRPYLDLEKVLEGLRMHAEKLFSINMAEAKGKYPVYHPDVKVYEVTDKKTGEMIGLFYADYYARPGAKRNGAWMDTLRDRGLEDGENKFAFVTNTCNFDKPTPEQPTLLSVDDLRTLFHEFGHGLHALLARGNYTPINGVNVKWDFVELPSQLQENWSKEKEILDSFAAHYKDPAKKIPAELIKKLHDSETFGIAYDALRQTCMALIDMKWHMTDPATIGGVEELEDEVIADAALFPRISGAISTNFGHLFAGADYAAGYYSYKWAEVLEADIFEEFQRQGLYDGATAQRLRDTVYSKGGTVDPMELFKEMMGREPDTKAMYRREGLLKEDPKNDNKKAAKPKPPKAG